MTPTARARRLVNSKGTEAADKHLKSISGCEQVFVLRVKMHLYVNTSVESIDVAQ